MANVWQSGVSGNWTTQGDWSADTVPVAGTTATIAASGTYTVTINSAVGVQTLTLDSLGATLLDSGTLSLGGVLSLDAGTFDLFGTIVGGTIVDSGSDLVAGGVLSGVTYDGGPLTLTQYQQSLGLANDNAVQNAAGTGPGTIDLLGQDDALSFIGNTTLGNSTINLLGQGDALWFDVDTDLGNSTIDVMQDAEFNSVGNTTLDNATIDLMSATFNYLFEIYSLSEEYGPSPSLTLGPHVVLNVSGYDPYVLVNCDYAGAQFVNEGTINVSSVNGEFIIDTPSFYNGGLITVSSGALLTIGHAMIDGGLVQLSGGTLAATSSNALTIAAGGTIGGFGTIVPPFNSNGLIVANGGKLDVQGGGGNGALIEVGATLELGFLLGGTITFAGPGDATLALDSPETAYASTLAGLGVGDTIDFLGTVVSHATTTGSDLLVEIGASTFTYDLAAPLSNGVLVVGDAAGTGSDVEIACFCRGTRVLTVHGERAVEDLVAGDELITRLGKARKLRWIGHRAYSGRFAAANPDVLPVHIRAGAIAAGVPRRDLFVSPRHALYLDHVLIPAAALVNDSTILRVEAVEAVEYFHVELATHDVILAEGVEAETYLDDGNRVMFDNAAEAPMPLDPPRYYAPRVETGGAVDAVRARLAARAHDQGFVVMPSLRVALDAVGSLRAALPPGVVELRLCSTSGKVIGDRRTLGALILGFRIDGVELDVADPCFRQGFHKMETHGRASVRWTNGEGLLMVAASDKQRMIEIDIGAVMAASVDGARAA